MKCYVSVFTIFVALKSVYSSITSNLSLNNKLPELNSGECLSRNVEVIFKNLENCNPNLGLNLFDGPITDGLKAESPSGPLNFEQLITLKLREHSCEKANEYLHENNCKVFAEQNKKKADSERKDHKNNTGAVADREKDSSISTTAIYLYGWLAYRLIFVVLQQI